MTTNEKFKPVHGGKTVAPGDEMIGDRGTRCVCVDVGEDGTNFHAMKAHPTPARFYTIKPLVWGDEGVPGIGESATVSDGEYRVWKNGWQFDQDDHYGIARGTSPDLATAKKDAEDYHCKRIEEYLIIAPHSPG